MFVSLISGVKEDKNLLINLFKNALIRIDIQKRKESNKVI